MEIPKKNPSFLKVLEGEDAVEAAAKLGVAQDDLHAAMRAGHLGAESMTPFHPKISSGFAFWEDSIGWFRERQSERGWTTSDPRNLPITTSPDGAVAISFAAGAAMTGIPALGDLRLSRKRGPTVRAAAIGNEQLALELEYSADPKEVTGVEQWMVVYYRDNCRREVRIELALPIEVSASGDVAGWHQRLVLAPWAMDSFGVSDGMGGGDDVIFPIGPK